MTTPSAAFVGNGAAAPGDGVAARRDKVLLVEDDDTVAALVTHILKRAQREVVRARDRAECLRVFQEQAKSILLVILDCRLPDSDGAALCRELRRSAPDLPILLTSGRDHSRESVVTDGKAMAFLRKPFRPVDVQEKVTALLGGAMA